MYIRGHKPSYKEYDSDFRLVPDVFKPFRDSIPSQSTQHKECESSGNAIKMKVSESESFFSGKLTKQYKCPPTTYAETISSAAKDKNPKEILKNLTVFLTQSTYPSEEDVLYIINSINAVTFSNLSTYDTEYIANLYYEISLLLIKYGYNKCASTTLRYNRTTSYIGLGNESGQQQYKILISMIQNCFNLTKTQNNALKNRINIKERFQNFIDSISDDTKSKINTIVFLSRLLSSAIEFQRGVKHFNVLKNYKELLKHKDASKHIDALCRIKMVDSVFLSVFEEIDNKSETSINEHLKDGYKIKTREKNTN